MQYPSPDPSEHSGPARSGGAGPHGRAPHGRPPRRLPAGAFLLPGALLASAIVGCGSLRGGSADRYPNPLQRRVALESVARLKGRNFQVVAARLQSGIDTSLAWRQLDTLLDAPTGDMFWTYPAAAFYFSCRDLLSDAWRARFRSAWKRYTPYRGDTENHFLMHYGALLLFSQEWPDLPGSEWFNGKSSAENHAEAAAYLNHWIDETVRQGMTEWDSPRYMYFYLTPLLTLAEYTEDPALKRKFEMMVEYLLADYADDYLAGSYTGAHSRDGDASAIDPRTGDVTSYGEFYFEDTLATINPDLAFTAAYRFQAPPILAAIAHDRSAFAIQRELKRSRARMRYAQERYTTVHRYTYMSPDLALGSIEGGIQQPIQQHTWGVTFAARRPNNTIFALHPDVSATELGSFFPEEPELMEEGVLASKGSYASPDKWVGGSRFESIGQYASTLVGLYEIPREARHHHVDFFLPKTLDTVIHDPSGWIICRMGGGFVGIRMLREDSLQWIDEGKNIRLRVADRHLRYAVECGSEQRISFDAFIRTLRDAGPLADSSNGFRYHSPFGPTLSFARRSDAPTLWRLDRVDDPAATGGGSAANSAAGGGTSAAGSPTLLFDSRHLRSELGSGVLELRVGGMRRILDFVENTIR